MDASRQLEELRQAAQAVVCHTSRVEIRRRNQLQADFARLATPQVVLELLSRLEKDRAEP